MGEFSWNRLPNNMKLTIIRKVDRRAYCRLWRTCKDVSAFLEDNVHVVKIYLPRNSDISVSFIEGDMKWTVNDGDNGRATVDVDEPSIRAFVFGIWRLDPVIGCSEWRTYNAGNIETIVNFLERRRWRRVCQLLETWDLPKDVLMKLVDQVKPVELTVSMWGVDHPLDYFDSPILQKVSTMDIRVTGGSCSPGAAILLKNCNKGKFHSLEWADHLAIRQFIRSWERGADCGRCRKILFECRDVLPDDEKATLDNFIEKEPFFSGIDRYEVSEKLKIWLLRRSLAGQREYAMVVMSSFRGGGVFQISQQLEDFLEEIRLELGWEAEEALEKMTTYFQKLDEIENDIYSSLAT